VALSSGKIVATDLNEAKYGYSRYKMTKYQQALVRQSMQALVKCLHLLLIWHVETDNARRCWDFDNMQVLDAANLKTTHTVDRRADQSL